MYFHVYKCTLLGLGSDMLRLKLHVCGTVMYCTLYMYLDNAHWSQDIHYTSCLPYIVYWYVFSCTSLGIGSDMS